MVLHFKIRSRRPAICLAGVGPGAGAATRPGWLRVGGPGGVRAATFWQLSHHAAQKSIPAAAVAAARPPLERFTAGIAMRARPEGQGRAARATIATCTAARIMGEQPSDFLWPSMLLMLMSPVKPSGPVTFMVITTPLNSSTPFVPVKPGVISTKCATTMSLPWYFTRQGA